MRLLATIVRLLLAVAAAWSAEVALADGARSLDEFDRLSFPAGPAPADAPAQDVALAPGAAEHPSPLLAVTLDPVWRMAEGGVEEERLRGSWTDAIPAAVPGSVHAALVAAGKIPDPKFGRNDAIANAQPLQSADFDIDHNLNHAAGKDGSRWNVAGAAYDFVAYRVAFAKDAHGLSADPGFVNRTGGGLHLKSGSPAIDVGADLGLARDADGNAVPQGKAPDLGLNEFTGTPHF